MADRVRPYLFYDVAISICTRCHARCDAKIVFEDGKVFLLKHCIQHGRERVLVADDIDYYRRCREVFLKPPEQPKDTTKLLAQARADAKTGDIDGADRAYSEAYDLAKQFDVLEERVAALVHASRAARAVELAKAFYETHATDAKGFALYAEALLANGKGDEALDVAT